MRQRFEINPSGLAKIQRDFDVQVASITLADASSKTFKHAIASEFSNQIDVFSTPQGQQTCVQIIMDRQEALFVTGSEPGFKSECPMMNAEGFKAYMGIPIFHNDTVSGAVEVMSRQSRDWTALEKAALAVFATDTQVVIRQARAPAYGNVVPFLARSP